MIISPIYTGPPTKVDSNPDLGSCSTGELNSPDCDLDLIAIRTWRTGSRKVVPCKQGFRASTTSFLFSSFDARLYIYMQVTVWCLFINYSWCNNRHWTTNDTKLSVLRPWSWLKLRWLSCKTGSRNPAVVSSLRQLIFIFSPVLVQGSSLLACMQLLWGKAEGGSMSFGVGLFHLWAVVKYVCSWLHPRVYKAF